MEKLDPQVQIRAIDLAEKWGGEGNKGGSLDSYIDVRAKYFDKAYKAIIKTLTEK